ncbi:transposase [Bacteroides sp.]|uniref:IS66 family transposase n=1 Tax=Bacteroides sp. TaxID=29523 RepID=UPI00260D85F2|nr:transposase [Bacteroides sp.]MDD3041081.1 transposase [Bacteroides sp.]
MAMKYTEEQLNNFDKTVLVQLLLANQEQLASIDQKLQLVLEQLASANHKRYGRSSEKLDSSQQIAFKEVDDQIVFFNEAEAVANLDDADYEEDTTKSKPGKHKGKREEDLSGLPIVKTWHTMTEDELREEFGEASWKQLPDEVYKRYKFTPSKVEVEEHHVAVYASKKDDHIIKAKHPGYLLRNSLVSPSLEAAILNGKYINAVPLYRLEKEFERYNLKITRQDMANWTIQCADRYLAILYDYLHEQIYDYHVLQADELCIA